MNIGQALSRIGLKTKVAIGMIAVAGLAFAAGSYGIDRALGQPGGPMGGGGVRTAVEFTNAGSTALCAQAAFDVDEDFVTPALFNGSFAFGQGTVVSSAPYAHNCTGNVTATFYGDTFTVANSGLFVRAFAQCTGGGCVGGSVTAASPGQPGYNGLDGEADFSVLGASAHTVVFVFQNLPRGRYTVTIEAVTFPAAGSTIAFSTLVVNGYGPPTATLP